MLLVVIFAAMIIANGIQTDGGRIDVSYGVIDTDAGRLTYKLYTPDTATEDSPAPGVLLLHGYQNDHETCAAYAIELARRGAVVLCTYIYRRTGSVYTGALTVASLACWIVTGGSSML